ncbi:MAG: RluA family pseudouridine synthase [Candidatus Omnitrophica bacterium]|nr:RluA family pseudouridine synthase [Candidatus Omnitrophota bacterium]MCM8799363.1 RluA family pseudouridine synthase [Candidatus Omnitrophota bacterium]
MKEFIFNVEPEDEGMRLDLFILKKFLKLDITISRQKVKELIKKGLIKKEDEKNNFKSHYKVKSNEVFKVNFEEEKLTLLTPEPIPIKIIYEDEDFALIEKPAGLVVHPGAGNPTHTLVNALIYHFKKLSQINPLRPGIVHRLDKDTSGLMVIAKNDKAHLFLAKQFSQHTVKREYVAIIKGCMEFDEDILELPLSRHPRERKKFWVCFSKEARYAKTKYKTLIRKKEASLVKLIPFTGRTHQLRVHLAFLGHPILGDLKYGKTKAEFKRLALHAQVLGFKHPTKDEFMEFSTPIPEDFLDYFKDLEEKK